MSNKRTLAYQAAEYFGVHHDEPHKAIRLGNGRYALTLERGGQRVLAFYDCNATGVKGEWFLLSEKQRELLAEALS